ncbi:MAG: MFS transporter [Oscillospiraceae bacterium]|nr:MFS transporter [Oscillospiraceae bacterium]
MDAMKRSRLLYIAEAGLEYLISILVAGSFLATLTRELGMSDSLTGILSSVITLGCLFQLLSVSWRPLRAKKAVVLLSVTNQLLFLLLYLIPLLNIGKTLKIAVFVAVVFLAYLVYNFAHPKKINWLMSLVEDGARGVFTANKEIVSLIMGMAFSFGMGALCDYFTARGETRMAFAISATVIFLVMVLHTLSMMFAVEPPQETAKRKPLRENLADVLKNKALLKISVVFVLYHVAVSVSTPFYGTYQIGELGFSLKYVSAVAVFGSFSRVLVSRAWGRYADRRSFAEMVEKCLLFFAAASLFVTFTTPQNGRVLFVIYSICHGIAMGGINSALINLVFDYVPVELRADSLAVCQAGSGLLGFLATICMSTLVASIQKNGNHLFGIPIYAQQVAAVLAAAVALFAGFYVRKNLIGKRREDHE